MAQRLRDAGFAESDMHIVGPNERKKNLVVRLRGSGSGKPILLIGHLDVVEARREDWTTDPFQFVEKDGFFYGRGTQDMKGDDAVFVTSFIRLEREGYHGDRDLILALTADEEGGKSNGINWLLENQRELIDADFVLNADGGGVATYKGKVEDISVDATEKLYADFELTTTNPGGHSSLPKPDNAIYHLANGLTRIEHYEFPFELNNVTRAYYERMAKIETGKRAADIRAMLLNPPDRAAIARLSEDAVDNSTVRTTCVATRLQAGHANNALPQRAQAIVNCRILPGHTSEQVRQILVGILADSKIQVRYVSSTGEVTDQGSSRESLPPPPLRADVFGPLEQVAGKLWPGAPIIPTMATGASDGVYTNARGLPTYGVSGIAIDRGDVRAHGQDERVGIASFYQGVDFYYRYLKALTSPSPAH
jgi:acetylornithine deacetylase/succinyl-diaminopimelate desuccinylase-like protein